MQKFVRANRVFRTSVNCDGHDSRERHTYWKPQN